MSFPLRHVLEVLKIQVNAKNLACVGVYYGCISRGQRASSVCFSFGLFELFFVPDNVSLTAAAAAAEKLILRGN